MAERYDNDRRSRSACRSNDGNDRGSDSRLGNQGERGRYGTGDYDGADRNRCWRGGNEERFYPEQQYGGQ